MKKIALAVLPAVLSAAALPLSGCGSAEVQYTLSEDKTHYIVSDVAGNKSALKSYDVPAFYSAEEGGELLPVTEIGDEAFMGCVSLHNVTIPQGIERIGVRAFMECAFNSFTIPDSVTSICYAAFGRCDALREITIPESVKVLEPYAFAYCSSLEKADIRATIEDLMAYTFVNPYAAQAGNIYTMTSLTEVYLPATLKKIHMTALDGNMLEDIYFGGSEEQWGEVYFYDYQKTEETDENGEPVYEERKREKSDALPAQTKVHFAS